MSAKIENWPYAVRSFVSTLDLSEASARVYINLLDKCHREASLRDREAAETWALCGPGCTPSQRMSVVRRWFEYCGEHQPRLTQLRELLPKDGAEIEPFDSLAQVVALRGLLDEVDPWDRRAVGTWLDAHPDVRRILIPAWRILQEHATKAGIARPPSLISTTLPLEIKACLGALLELLPAKHVAHLRWKNARLLRCRWQIEAVDDRRYMPNFVFYEDRFRVSAALAHLRAFFVDRVGREPGPEDPIPIDAYGGRLPLHVVRQCKEVPFHLVPEPSKPEPRRAAPLQPDEWPADFR